MVSYIILNFILGRYNMLREFPAEVFDTELQKLDLYLFFFFELYRSTGRDVGGMTEMASADLLAYQ